MKDRILGKNLTVSPIGLGCMGLTHAYGPALEISEAVPIIQDAFDIGYTFFDTAECYTGKTASNIEIYNEIVVGKALKSHRKEVKIATKCGVVIKEGQGLLVDSSPETIRKSVESSLKRLETDYIDLYYQHRIDPKTDPEVVAEVMGDLIKEGKILNWGISEVDAEYLRRANAVTSVTAIQNRFSMMARWYENLFPVLEELNIGFVAFSPLANGFLSDTYSGKEKFTEGDFRNRMPQYTEEAVKENYELISFIRELAKEYNATPSQIALAWLLNKKPYIVPIPGSRKVSRIKSNFEAANINLTANEMNLIDQKLNNIPISQVFGGTNITNN